MTLCQGCMKEPVFVKYCRLGKRCYNREWRKSQGPGSKYRARASISSIKRKVSEGAGGTRVGGEVDVSASAPSGLLEVSA